MNWYKQAYLDFGQEMSDIGNFTNDFNSSPYTQQQGQPDDKSLDMDQLNQQLDINNSKNDPDIKEMEADLVAAEDQDGDGNNDIEQLIEELQVEASYFPDMKKTAQNKQPWLDAAAWQSMGAYSQEQYNSSINTFRANVTRYRTLKDQLAEQKNLYDKGQIKDKGVLRNLVDETIKWVFSSKEYGLKAKRMKEALDQIRATLTLFAENSERVIEQNGALLNHHYFAVLNMINE
jgi:hypothetical protein